MSDTSLNHSSKTWCYAATATAITYCLVVNFSGDTTFEFLREVGNKLHAVLLVVVVLTISVTALVTISLLSAAFFYMVCTVVGYGVRRMMEHGGKLLKSQRDRDLSADVGVGIVTSAAAFILVGFTHWISQASTSATISTLVAGTIAGVCATRVGMVARLDREKKAAVFVMIFSAINVLVALPSIPNS